MKPCPPTFLLHATALVLPLVSRFSNHSPSALLPAKRRLREAAAFLYVNYAQESVQRKRDRL